MLMNLKDVAKELNVSTQTVLRLIKSDRLPCVYVLNAIRVEPCDLTAFIQSAKKG